MIIQLTHWARYAGHAIQSDVHTYCRGQNSKLAWDSLTLAQLIVGYVYTWDKTNTIWLHYIVCKLVTSLESGCWKLIVMVTSIIIYNICIYVVYNFSQFIVIRFKFGGKWNILWFLCDPFSTVQPLFRRWRWGMRLVIIMLNTICMCLTSCSARRTHLQHWEPDSLVVH